MGCYVIGRSEGTILTDIFTRQIPQNLTSATVKITGIPKKTQYFLVGHSDAGDLASKSPRSVDTQRPLSVNLAKLPIQKSEEFEVGNDKSYQHPKESPIFFSRSVKMLVRMVCARGLLGSRRSTVSRVLFCGQLGDFALAHT